jgi:hypothetical protein
VTADWGTVVTRRASKKPIAEGGWNIFETGWVGADLLDPSLNVMLRTNGESAWFGWPKDDKLEELRTEWLKASDSEARQEIAANPAACLRDRALCPDRAIRGQDRLSQEHERGHCRPGILYVERREDLIGRYFITSTAQGANRTSRSVVPPMMRS